jgi:GT2 family glycosyltransferase
VHIKYSIILVNYHSIAEIQKFIISLKEVHSTIDYELIIPSNSPVTTEEMDQIDNLHPVIWVHIRENIGYGRACNEGALRANGDYIFIVNPDTYFLNDLLPILSAELEENSEAAVAGPATFDEDGEWIPSVKNRISLGWFITRIFPFLAYIFPKTGSHYRKTIRNTQKVDVLNGSALLFKASDFRDAGGFSDNYFMFWEENDLCTRLREEGKEILFVPDARLVHSGGHSVKRNFIPMEIEKHRSQKIFIKTHHPFLYYFNRVSGITAYFWRTVLSVLTLQFRKVKQFGSLFIWYLFRYA